MLETLADYLQYEIVPPKEMHEEYYRLVINSQKNEENIVKSRIDYILSLSEEQSKWWNTNYPLENKKPMNLDKSGGSQVSFRAPTVVDSVQEEFMVVEESSMANVEVEESSPAFVVVNEVSRDEVQESRNQAPVEEMRLEMSDNADFAVAQDRAPAPPAQREAESNELRKAKKLNGDLKADIQLNAWDPQTPYLKVLQYTTKGQEYQTYLKLKTEYGTTPAFYIDASDFFAKLGNTDTAVKIISNLAELKLEAPQLLRVLGEKLIQLKQYKEAVTVYEKVLKLKGEEPQSYRDLGLACSASGNPQQAIKTLYEVITKNWDGRFPGIELIVLNEINNIIAQNPKVEYSFIDKRLIKKEPVDIRVVLSWDTDNCDMDLWVTDPSTEKCYYQNKHTHYGGKISNDFTSGYGPEEYMMKNALSGEYVIQTNYYGTRAQTQLTPVTLHLAFYTNYGKPNQEMQDVTIRLENQKDVIDIGKFSFKVK